MSEELTPWQKYKQNLGDSRPWDLVNPGKARADEDVASKRLDICLSCPELIKLTKQCKKCGCFMSAKVKLDNAACPIGKW
ncbi:hypothetical protein EBU71_13735 [bacterium]|nr:hypothetical protein [Candidatus Elulimicrobium humile]